MHHYLLQTDVIMYVPMQSSSRTTPFRREKIAACCGILLSGLTVISVGAFVVTANSAKQITKKLMNKLLEK